MTHEFAFEARRGEGPVGTGVHVLRGSPGPAGTTIADVWLTVLFLPVVPFGTWTMERGGGSGSAWRVTQVGRPHLSKSTAIVVVGALAVLASLLPAYVAVTFLVGSKATELGGLFSSVGAIIGALGWLDQTRDRVPFRAAVRLLGRPPIPPERGDAVRKVNLADELTGPR